MQFRNLHSVRRPKNKRQQKTVSPSPAVFRIKGSKRPDPQDLKREISVTSQTVWSEDTLKYGEDDALPLRIAQAVEESPAASSCIATISKFIKGSGFSDPELQKFVIDKDGTTLWDLHCNLADSLALFWGFAVNFKLNEKGKITNCFQLSFESCRFKAPGEDSPYITHIMYNPYFGTEEKRTNFTKCYSIFNPKIALDEIGALEGKAARASYPGQVYYFGKTSPLSRFYPKPKYWSAKEAIQADHKLQEFTNEELDNGFFQSTLINAIGDPNLMSSNPETQKEVVGDDGVTRLEPTETIGQEFNRQMSDTFSGSSKAGTAMVLWASTPDESIKLQAFPTTINSDRLVATQDSITKTITIATEVPSILANISEGVSLGSGGSEIQKAVELMQSRTVEWREVLENFYNNILIPNLEEGAKGKQVEIQSFKPVSEPIEINKDVWEFLNEAEKIAFIKKNMPEIEIIRTQAQLAPPPDPAHPAIDPNAPDAPAPDETAQAADPNQDAIDALIRGLSRKELSKFWGYVNDYRNGRATLEQAKLFLRAYKFTDDQIMLFLNEEK